MIQVYEASNTDFNSNGDMTLTPSKAEIHAILNGAWTASLSHPIDKDGRWKFIEENAVVKMPSFLEDDQLFRIKKRTVSDSGVEAELEPIFYDSIGDCFLVDVRPTNDNGQQALDMMTAVNSKYSGSSNITKTSTAYYQFKNLMEAINGEDDNAFVKRWGGEILFDNFEVIIDEQVGSDHGVELRYGKNLPVDGLTEDVDMTEVVTRIYPQAYNGRKPSGSLGRNIYVDSPIIDSYPAIHSATITFDNVKLYLDASEDEMKGLADNDVYVCYNQAELDAVLEHKCEEEFQNGIDKPSVNIEAEIVLLKNTEQYRDYAVLEDVSLGDTIHCKHNRLGIVTDARVISLEYDCILKKVNSVELGDFSYNYFSDVSSTVSRVDSAIRPDGTVIAQKITGIVDGMKASLRVQKSIAEKQDVRAVLFEDLDPDSPTYGAMCLGTQGFQIANERTSDDRDWDWRTFGTATGFSADLITAGTLAAINILGSVITGGTISGTTITGSTIRGNTISGGTITGTTINGGTLTSESANGKLKITISNGKILIDNNGDANTLNEIQLTYEGGNTVRLSSTGLRMQDNSGDQTTVIYPGRIYLNGKSIT